MSTTKNHIRQTTQAQLAGGAKPYLEKADIDIEKYSSHSTRSASASKTKIRGLLLSEINKEAGWKDKPIYRAFGYINSLKIVYEYFVQITEIFLVIFPTTLMFVNSVALKLQFTSK